MTGGTVATVAPCCSLYIKNEAERVMETNRSMPFIWIYEVDPEHWLPFDLQTSNTIEVLWRNGATATFFMPCFNAIGCVYPVQGFIMVRNSRYTIARDGC
ncbi:hypothetical protein BJV82DRAFT_663467 [Fennellomyces sp. T-0311]|nr:hypothetical protein BJV82DRAFT_663467 [Fennellomyces sp. T-0311]